MQAEPPAHVLAGVHEFGTTALAFTPDGRRFISGGLRGDIRIWDAQSRQSLTRLRGHSRAVRALLPLPTGDLVSGGDDGRLVMWRDGRIRALANGPRVTALALFGGQVVSGHADGRLRVWSADTLAPMRDLPLGGRVVALARHADQLAVGLTRDILLLDTAYARRRSLPTPHAPHDLQFSPDGRYLAAGNWFRLSLWNLADGTRRSLPTEHNGLVTSLAFSPDGRHLATLGRHTDSAIRIMDTGTFGVVQRYQAHDLCGALIRFSPDGRTLLSGSDDESLRLYRVSESSYSSSGAIPSAH